MAQRKARAPWPPEQLDALERELAAGTLHPGYLLKGEERWFRDRAVERIVAAARERGLELARHDGNDPDFSLPSLLDDLGAAPMVPAGRVVVVIAPEAKKLTDKRADGKPSAFTSAALSFLERKGGVLVVSSRSLRADHALAKAIRAAGGPVLDLRKLWATPPPWGNPDPTRTELAQWVARRARELGVRLSPREAAYVAGAVGNDLAEIDSRLGSLATGGTGDLLRDVPWESAQAPWELADPILDGDLAKALVGLQSLFSAGFEDKEGRERDPAALANVLAGSLRNPLRQALSIARALEAGATEAQAGAAVGGAPQTRQRAVARAARRPAREWERMLFDLAEVERAARSGARVDAADFFRLALRWRRAPQTARGRGRSA